MARNELRKTPQNVEAEISVLGCGFLDRTALDKIMDALSTIGFRAVNDSGFFFAESEALGKRFRASASGRDKLWAIASKLADCCKVFSEALVGAGYSALVK